MIPIECKVRVWFDYRSKNVWCVTTRGTDVRPRSARPAPASRLARRAHDEAASSPSVQPSRYIDPNNSDYYQLKCLVEKSYTSQNKSHSWSWSGRIRWKKYEIVLILYPIQFLIGCHVYNSNCTYIYFRKKHQHNPKRSIWSSMCRRTKKIITYIPSNLQQIR